LLWVQSHVVGVVLRALSERDWKRFRRGCSQRLQDQQAPDGYELIKRADFTVATTPDAVQRSLFRVYGERRYVDGRSGQNCRSAPRVTRTEREHRTTTVSSATSRHIGTSVRSEGLAVC